MEIWLAVLRATAYALRRSSGPTRRLALITLGCRRMHGSSNKLPPGPSPPPPLPLPSQQSSPPCRRSALSRCAALRCAALRRAVQIAVLKETDGKGPYCSLVMAVVVVKDVLLFACFAVNMELARAVVVGLGAVLGCRGARCWVARSRVLAVGSLRARGWGAVKGVSHALPASQRTSGRCIALHCSFW